MLSKLVVAIALVYFSAHLTVTGWIALELRQLEQRVVSVERSTMSARDGLEVWKAIVELQTNFHNMEKHKNDTQ